MVNGGVKLHKIQSTMNDTCNTAKKSAGGIADASNDSGIEHYGAETWAAMSAEEKSTSAFLCGNHTRNLPIDEFNRLFDQFLADDLGDGFDAAVAAGGSRARLEKSGTSLLRSVCKLAHDGHGAYSKGDGREVTGFMEEHDEAAGAMGMGKRV
jgi:hypothetical protein